MAPTLLRHTQAPPEPRATVRATKRRRVIFVHPTLGIGGAEQLRAMVVRTLDKRWYDIRICCLQEKGTLGESLEKEGFAVDCLEGSSRLRDFGTTLRLIRYLRRHPADIVQTSLMPANWHGRFAALFARVPHLITEEHSIGDRFDPRWGWIMRLFQRWPLRRPDARLACSRAVARTVEREDRLPPGSIRPILNAIDRSRLRPFLSRTAVRELYGVPENSWLIVCVGNLSPVKGHDVLLAAFDAVRREHPHARLLLAGEGPERPALEEQVAATGLEDFVLMPGAVQELGDILHAADTCVIPSRMEGFGLTLLEGMAAGKPCIATRVGGVEEFARDEQTALLVPPDDAQALASAMLRLLRDPALSQSLAKRASEQMRDYFSAERYVTELMALYETLDPRRND